MNAVTLLEESAQQTPSNVTHDATRQSAVGKSRRLAEAITPRESHRVGNGQNKGDDYRRMGLVHVIKSTCWPVYLQAERATYRQDSTRSRSAG
jgi:hypothetical protein